MIVFLLYMFWAVSFFFPSLLEGAALPEVLDVEREASLVVDGRPVDAVQVVAEELERRRHLLHHGVAGDVLLSGKVHLPGLRKVEREGRGQDQTRTK